MDTKTSKKVLIRWITDNAESIRLIRERFGILTYTTLNGITPAILKPEDIEDFEATAKRGYISYRIADWSFNGIVYSW